MMEDEFPGCGLNSSSEYLVQSLEYRCSLLVIVFFIPHIFRPKVLPIGIQLWGNSLLGIKVQTPRLNTLFLRAQNKRVASTTNK
jgi:hypothetical protein